MSNKGLIFRYILLTLIVSFSFSFILHNYKKVEISKLLNDNLIFVNDNYNNYRTSIQQQCELFFFNHVSNNKELLKLLKIKLNKKEKSNKIFELFKDELYFFKKYDIKEINFYSKDIEPIFRSSLKKYSKQMSPSHRSLIKSLKDKKESFLGISISFTSPSVKYIRPIFDEKLNVIAFFEVAMNMPKFAHKIHGEKNFFAEFIYKKDLLEKNLSSTFFNRFEPYFFDDFMYEKSFYNNRNPIKILDKKIKEQLEKGLNKKIGFSEGFEYKNQFVIKTFIPRFQPITKKLLGYIVVTRFDKNFIQIVNRYNRFIFITVLIVILIMSLIYTIHRMYINDKIINSKLDSINKSIDKYVIVAETNLAGIITYASQAFCDISGYKKEEIIGRPINIIRSPDISKKFFENMWKRLNKHEHWEGEIKNIDKNGNSYWVKGNIVPIYNEKNMVTGYRSIRVNISDEKQLLKINSLLKRDLFLKLNEIKTKDKTYVDESKIKLMSQLLDAFSNEWKKPISNISSRILDFENRISNKSYDEKQLNEFISVLSNEIKSLSIHLNEFKMLFSNKEQNDKYNVYSVVENVVSSLYPKDVLISFDGDKDLETYGVSFDLRKILLGILNNSIEEFKIKNIKDAKIDIEIKKDNEDILIKCQDNAGGIPKEVMPNIFNLDFSTKPFNSSTGLPLNVAKLLIKKSNGDIWVKNENGGCCFYIKLITKNRRVNRKVLS